MRLLSYIFSLLLMLFGITFATLNADAVIFNYYFSSVKISLALLLVISLGIGIFLGFLAMLFNVIKLKKNNYHLKTRLKIIEKELDNLRSLPINGE